MFGLSPLEMLIVLAIAVLLFGSKRLPDLARSVGKSVTEFRKGMRGEGKDIR
jgi:sec-independent protein translocase protein TatA